MARPDSHSPADRLEIHPGLVMKGELSMINDVLLTGRFEGSLHTFGCVTVTAGGALLGSLEAGALVLEPGYEVEARIKVSHAEAPRMPDRPQSSSETPAGKWPLSFSKLKDMTMGHVR